MLVTDSKTPGVINYQFDSGLQGTVTVPWRRHSLHTKSLLVQGDFASPTGYYNTSFKYAIGGGSIIESRTEPAGTGYRWYPYFSQFGPIKPGWYDGKCPVYPGDRTSGTLNTSIALTPPNLINKVLSRLNSSQVEMGVTLGEVGQTASYLAHRGASLWHALMEIKKGRVAKGFKRLDLSRDPRKAVWFERTPRKLHNYRRYNASTSVSAAQAWTESRYALRPLVNDVSAYSNIVNNGLEQPLLITARAKSIENYNVITRRQEVGDVLLDRWSHDYQFIHNIKLVARPDYAKLSAMRALGLDNRLSIAYELIPFSFMLDWIYPLGDFISTFSGTCGLEFVGAYRSVKVTGKSKYSYYRNPGRSTAVRGARSSIEKRNAVITAECYSRTPLPAFPLPRLPEFENALSISKWVDLASITRLLANR